MSIVRPAKEPSWFRQFSAVAAGVLLAGLLLLLGVRLYLHWSVSDTIQRVNERQKARATERD